MRTPPALFLAIFLALSPALPALPPSEQSPHTVRSVEVEKDVKLEVLETGRPLILLAGLGFEAHSFDTFAPRLAARCHVYGISRRGYGASSVLAPTPENFSATRLGEDVLRVMEVLKIERPVLAGHSIAGEELSEIGIHHPEKIAGLIYLDAGYFYAYYTPGGGDGNPQMDCSIVRHEMDTLFTPISIHDRKAALRQLVGTDLPRFERDMQDVEKEMAAEPDSTPTSPDSPATRSEGAVMRGVEVHRGVKCPVLAIFAVPHDFSRVPGLDAPRRAEMIEKDRVEVGAQIDAFQSGNPQAHIVRLPKADHLVFNSNEADVLREVYAVLATLP